MSVAVQQASFMDQILSEDQPLPAGWTPRMAAGLAVYRNAYRTRLVEVLQGTFPRTLKWVGEAAFDQAAAHHLIVKPPRSWTVDLAGAGFPKTVAELFGSDPEVGDLAWLEWAMHLNFVATDPVPIDAQQFSEATAAFDDDGWTNLTVGLIPDIHIRDVAHDIVGLWQALDAEVTPELKLLETPQACIVWREGLRSVCAQWPVGEGALLQRYANGHSFGRICEDLSRDLGDEAAAALAGQVLAKLIAMGFIERITG
jgi:Putative DNA-binding domain